MGHTLLYSTIVFNCISYCIQFLYKIVSAVNRPARDGPSFLASQARLLRFFYFYFISFIAPISQLFPDWIHNSHLRLRQVEVDT